MRIEMENGAVVLSAENWKALSEDEHKYLYKCYSYAMWVGFTPSGKLKMRVPDKVKYKADLLQTAISYAESRGIEVADEVRAELEQWQEKAMEERLLEDKLAYIESLRRRWESRQRTGCAGCRQCERIGDGWFRCGYSGDDLDARFSEVYDPETQCMLIFHEVGEPNEHCKDYYQERKESRR